MNTRNGTNQPGPLSAGSEYPSDAAWEAFFSAVWTTYETLMARRAAKQTELKIITNDAEVMPGGQDRA